MKLSLRWLFDHLAYDYNTVDIARLIDDVGKKVVEIEEVHTLSYIPESFVSACVESIHEEYINLYDQEADHIVRLAPRANVELNQYYFVKKTTESWQWTTLKDAGSSKEGLFPTLNNHQAYNRHTLVDDTILTISNTAITHRPDLWSHRGFAQELCVLLGCSLIIQEQFMHPLKYICSSDRAIKGSSYSLKVKDPSVCSAFGLLSITVSNSSSNAHIALRLAAVDIKPINLLVDIGNYCMADWGQPLHVYDASKIKSTTLSLDMAHHTDLLLLLDGTTLKSSSTTLMVYDDTTPIGLAGIMGGMATSVNVKSSAIVVESGCFDAQVIRKSAQDAHLRTDASTRFEKGLDQRLVVQGLQRFVKLLSDYTQNSSIDDCIVYAIPSEQRSIIVKHSALEKLLGITIAYDFVTCLLNALGFSITLMDDQYTIKIPSWRLKDVSTLADIAEEVGRFYGWNTIGTALAPVVLAPCQVSSQIKIMQLKRVWAYTQQAHEVLNYPVWHEELFSLFDWYPTGQPVIKNPVSHGAKTLVSSLLPSLVYNSIKNIHSPYKRLSLFEVNPVWYNKKQIEELTSWAITYYRPNEPFNFAYHKQALCNALLSIGYTVSFRACSTIPFVWYDRYCCAQVFVDTTPIGYAGRLSKSWSNHLQAHAEVFIAEIDLDTLFKSRVHHIAFKEPSKFQSSWLDVSMLLSLHKSIDQVMHDMVLLDPRITDSTLQDIFIKKEWIDQRSVTLRFTIIDYEKQLTKLCLEDIQTKLYAYCAQQAIGVR